MTHRCSLFLLLALALICFTSQRSESQEARPWSTYRGNLQRTGNTDGFPGPARPNILWLFKGSESFVAAPVAKGDRLYVSGLGSFNVSSMYALATEPRAKPRVVWSKTTPTLKLPVVSSPAISGGLLFFGDGMHQTEGAVLHCMDIVDGLSLWELPVPGSLVHLEGSPTVHDGRVFVGAGDGGVLCVSIDQVMLEGQKLDLATVRKRLRTKWRELVARFEKEKKEDPDFAAPPDEDKLPKPEPVKIWQQGAEQWHVDAPVAVAGERVLVASSYLEKERRGTRALLCLNAANGKIEWQTPLRLNPWGGPSVLGETAVVGGSTIGYDPGALKEAKGDITAMDLATGTIKWRRAIDGGILSCVALAEGLAIATCTDGKIRSFDIATGALRWQHDTKTPFFAPPAVASHVVYAADLKGVIHALTLDKGEVVWKLDLNRDSKLPASGAVYGGPIVHNRRLFVATCNLHGNVGGTTFVACIGEQ
jgi:outer membrane protein assembly factor BamB